MNRLQDIKKEEIKEFMLYIAISIGGIIAVVILMALLFLFFQVVEKYVSIASNFISNY